MSVSTVPLTGNTVMQWQRDMIAAAAVLDLQRRQVAARCGQSVELVAALAEGARQRLSADLGLALAVVQRVWAEVSACPPPATR
ncbi:MAG TPA: hypothetical protein VFP72_22135 [Kineosporiaceae bacterium]|nr:hypothetical protein [Kineosporiaceae bacterium]